MNYGYEYSGEKLTLYFHCAKVGKKLDIIKTNPIGCFEMDCEHKLIEGNSACSYTMLYESVIGSGIITICEDEADKIYGLTRIMAQYAPDKEFDFPKQALNNVTIFKLVAAEFTGKRNSR